MDKWAKKKRAAESCGGQGMAKFIDSNETRRLNRLKNVRSSIGSSMTHNGWLKEQVEKRRKEQLRQRKKQAEKSPIGEGILVDTGRHPFDYTKTGLRLKLDQSALKTNSTKEQKKIENIALLQRGKQRVGESSLTINRRDIRPRSPFHRKRAIIPIKKSDASMKTSTDDHLVDDVFIVDSTTPETTRQQSPSGNVPTSHRDLDSDEEMIRRNDGCIASKLRCQYQDEDKENSEDFNSQNVRSRAKENSEMKKSVGKKKHFQHMNDISSLKREHADAIEMLKELDRAERNKRRSMDAETSIHSYASESDEENFNDDFEFESNDEIASKKKSDTVSHTICDSYNHDSESCKSVSLSQERLFHGSSNILDANGYADIHDYKCFNDTQDVSYRNSNSLNVCDDIESSHESYINDENNDALSWLPEGIKNMTHLSISIRDIEGDGREDSFEAEADSVSPQNVLKHFEDAEVVPLESPTDGICTSSENF